MKIDTTKNRSTSFFLKPFLTIIIATASGLILASVFAVITDIHFSYFGSRATWLICSIACIPWARLGVYNLK